MAMYNHQRPLGPAPHPSVARISDLLETLKTEYETLVGEVAVSKRQREEQDAKIQAVIADFVKIQESLETLETRYKETVKNYEDEILRLRTELKQAGVPTSHAQPQPPFPNSTNSAAGPPLKRPRQDDGPTNGASTPNSQPAPVVKKLQSQAAASGGSSPAPAPAKPVQTPAFAGDSHAQEFEGEPRTAPNQDWSSTFFQRLHFSEVDLLHSFMHKSVVCCVKFSPDGKYLATGSNRAAQVFDVSTGKLASEIIESVDRDGDLYIRSVCFSPDGKLLATGAEDKQIRIYDIRTRALRMTLQGHEHEVYSLDFAKDGRYIVSGSGDKTAKFWDIETAQCLITLGREDEASMKGDAGITSVSLSPDARLVAAGSLDEIVRVWDLRSGALVDRFVGHDDSVYSVAFSPDGKHVVSGSLDKTLRLWEVGARHQRSPCRMVFRGHTDYVLSVAFSPDGNSIVSGSKDRTVRFWDPKTGSTTMQLVGHNNSVISVAMSLSGNLFATGSGDMLARTWVYS